MKHIKCHLMNLFLIGIAQSASSFGMENDEDTQSSHSTITDKLQMVLPPSLTEEEKIVNAVYEGNYFQIEKLNPLQWDHIEQNALNNPKYAFLLIQTGDINKFPLLIEKIIKDAHQGLAAAQNNLGIMYQVGKGVKQDYAEAVKWFRLSANQGFSAAQGNLGFMYHLGKGVEQNDTKAVKWFRLGANQGLAAAQTNLGFMYEEGKGVERNYAEAVKWYQLGAEQGNAAAQTNLKSLLKYQLDESPPSIEPFDFTHLQTLSHKLSIFSGLFGFYERISDEEMAHLQGAISGLTPLHNVWSSLAQSVSSWAHILDRIQNAPEGLLMTCLTSKTEKIKQSLLSTQDSSISAFEYEGKFYLSLGEETAALSMELIQMIQKDGPIDQAIHLIIQHQHSINNQLSIDEFMVKIEPHWEQNTHDKTHYTSSDLISGFVNVKQCLEDFIKDEACKRNEEFIRGHEWWKA